MTRHRKVMMSWIIYDSVQSSRHWSILEHAVDPVKHMEGCQSFYEVWVCLQINCKIVAMQNLWCHRDRYSSAVEPQLIMHSSSVAMNDRHFRSSLETHLFIFCLWCTHSVKHSGISDVRKFHTFCGQISLSA